MKTNNKKNKKVKIIGIHPDTFKLATNAELLKDYSYKKKPVKIEPFSMRNDMEYTCKCTPKQNIPHIIRSASAKPYFFSIPYRKGKRLLLFTLWKHLSPAKSCDNHPVPLKKWEIGRFEFGKIVYEK